MYLSECSILIASKKGYYSLNWSVDNIMYNILKKECIFWPFFLKKVKKNFHVYDFLFSLSKLFFECGI